MIGAPELLILAVLVIGLPLYFLPTIVAHRRKKVNVAAITALNVFAGWTLVGWIVALVWAFSIQAADRQGATR